VDIVVGASWRDIFASSCLRSPEKIADRTSYQPALARLAGWHSLEFDFTAGTREREMKNWIKSLQAQRNVCQNRVI
jgi:hypothetical protein